MVYTGSLEGKDEDSHVWAGGMERKQGYDEVKTGIEECGQV